MPSPFGKKPVSTSGSSPFSSKKTPTTAGGGSPFSQAPTPTPAPTTPAPPQVFTPQPIIAGSPVTTFQPAPTPVPSSVPVPYSAPVVDATPEEEALYKDYNEASATPPVSSLFSTYHKFTYTEEELIDLRNIVRDCLVGQINAKTKDEIYDWNTKIKLAEADFYQCQRQLTIRHDTVMISAYNQMTLSISEFWKRINL